MNPETTNPLKRLQVQLRENTKNGLIPPEPPAITLQDAAELLCAALNHSVTLRIITQEEHEELRSEALQSDPHKLVQAKTFVNVINALVQGIDVRPDQANFLIRLLCAADADLAGMVMCRMLEDLGKVDTLLDALRLGGKVSEDQFHDLSKIGIGLDRVSAVLESEASAPASKKSGTGQ